MNNKIKTVKIGMKHVFLPTKEQAERCCIREEVLIPFKTAIDGTHDGETLYIDASMGRGEVVKMAGYDGPIDFAYPHDWWKENKEEVERRGGCVWYYGENSWGAPLYWDEVMRTFKCVIRVLLAEGHFETEEIS